MTTEAAQIIQKARGVGGKTFEGPHTDDIHLLVPRGMTAIILFDDELLAFYRSARCDGLQEAAGICDAEETRHSRDPSSNDFYSCADSNARSCEEVASLIRAKIQGLSK